MKSFSQRTAVYIGALFFFCLIVYTLGNSWPLTDPDEPVYAQTAKEMLFSGNFLSPQIYGVFWYDKPPLTYWSIAASFSVFGISEWAARLPSALAAGALVSYLAWTWQRRHGRQIAFSGALILVSMLEFTLLAHASVTDMWLALFLTISLLGVLEKRTVLPYIASGLAVLTKGPIGFFFPFVLLCWSAYLARNTRVFREMRLGRGMCIALAVAAPWYIYMTVVHGDPFIQTFLGYHNVTRFLSPEHPAAHAWWRYIPILLVGAIPWTMYLLPAGKRIYHRASPDEKYLAGWVAIVFLFFSLSATQLTSYILPLFPPLALLIAHALPTLSGKMTRCIQFVDLLAIIGIFYFIYAESFPGAGTELSALRSAVFFSIPFALRIVWTYLRPRQIEAHLVPALILTCQLGLFLYTAPATDLAHHYSVKEAVPVIRSLPADAPLYIDPFLRPGVAFYTDRYGQPLPKSQAAITPHGIRILQTKKLTNRPARIFYQDAYITICQ